MTDVSLRFLAFAVVIVIAARLVRRPWWWRMVMLAASLLFLWLAAEGRNLLPLAAFVALGYAGLKLIESGRKRLLLPVVLTMVVVFTWLKGYSFFPAGWLLPFPYVALGISYIVFRVLHLQVDAAAGELPGSVDPVSYLIYTLNFTTLVSGPIQRYQDHHSQAKMPIPLDVFRVGSAVERVINGFFKVNVLAMAFSAMRDRAAPLLTPVTPWEPRMLAAAIMFAAYPLFLYCNFSGYIDVVIGIARLLGLDLPENFNRPFSSDSFLGFWSRWHITLSEWLKTYVYNPLLMGLMRRFPSESMAPVFGVGAFFVTFFLVGVWHGQTSTFLFFGVLQGLGVSVNKLYQILAASRLGKKRYKALASNPFYIAICRGLTFTWFTFTLVWFWSNWPQIGQFAAALGLGGLAAVWGGIFLTATLGLAAWEAVRSWVTAIGVGGSSLLQSRYIRVAWSTTLAAVSMATGVLVRQPAPQIVYKVF